MSSSCKFAGRLFQTRGPATAKLLSPNVLCVRGTAHDLSVDERSRRRGPSETKCMSSARYKVPGQTMMRRQNMPVWSRLVAGLEASATGATMQLAQHWRDVVPSSSSSEKPSRSILDRLSLLGVAARHAIKQWVTIVQATRYKRLDECSACFVCQWPEYWAKLTQVIETIPLPLQIFYIILFYMCWQWQLMHICHQAIEFGAEIQYSAARNQHLLWCKRIFTLNIFFIISVSILLSDLHYGREQLVQVWACVYYVFYFCELAFSCPILHSKFSYMILLSLTVVPVCIHRVNITGTLF